MKRGVLVLLGTRRRGNGYEEKLILSESLHRIEKNSVDAGELLLFAEDVAKKQGFLRFRSKVVNRAMLPQFGPKLLK